MLSPLNLTSKNLDQTKQMAVMRTYINDLRDDTEKELYDIKWANLSKDLQDKINSLDKEIASTNDMIGYLQASVISADYIKANELFVVNGSARQFLSNYLYAGSITAAQISSGTISAQYIDAALLRTNDLDSQTIYCDQLVVRDGDQNGISAGMIKTGTLAADRISSAIMRTSQFTADAINAQLTLTDTLIVNGRHYKERAFSYEGVNLYILTAPRNY